MSSAPMYLERTQKERRRVQSDGRGASAAHGPIYKSLVLRGSLRVQELCESRGGLPGLSVLMRLTVSVDVKQH